MHFMVAWNAGEGKRAEDISAQMENVLKGYSWVSPLRNVYVIRISTPVEWTIIFAHLKETAATFKGEVTFILSPLMNGGKYIGELPEALLAEIQQRTL